MASANLACDNLIGTWSSERYDNTLSSKRRTIKAMEPDGSYWIKFIHDNGEEISEQQENGKWSCEGNTLSIEITQIDDTPVYFYNQFELSQANATVHTLKPIAPNCASVIGDCSTDILLEYYRVLN